MPCFPLSRSRSLPTARLRAVGAALLAVLLWPAAALASCDDSPHPLDCRLSGVLHLLTIAAVLLGLLLALVVLLAVRSFRRHREERQRDPGDIL